MVYCRNFNALKLTCRCVLLSNLFHSHLTHPLLQKDDNPVRKSQLQTTLDCSHERSCSYRSVLLEAYDKKALWLTTTTMISLHHFAAQRLPLKFTGAFAITLIILYQVMKSVLAPLHNILSYGIEQSNYTPRCSREVSAAGLPWLEHFRVQCYT